jgi:hypothetical protein
VLAATYAASSLARSVAASSSVMPSGTYPRSMSCALV